MAEKVGYPSRRQGKSRVKAFIVAGVIIIVFLPSFVKYEMLRYKNAKLEEKLVSLDVENRRLEEEKRRLETDITYIEKKARQEMGLARKGEIILKEMPVRK